MRLAGGQARTEQNGTKQIRIVYDEEKKERKKEKKKEYRIKKIGME